MHQNLFGFNATKTQYTKLFLKTRCSVINITMGSDMVSNHFLSILQVPFLVRCMRKTWSQLRKEQHKIFESIQSKKTSDPLIRRLMEYYSASKNCLQLQNSIHKIAVKLNNNPSLTDYLQSLDQRTGLGKFLYMYRYFFKYWEVCRKFAPNSRICRRNNNRSNVIPP